MLHRSFKSTSFPRLQFFASLPSPSTLDPILIPSLHLDQLLKSHLPSPHYPTHPLLTQILIKQTHSTSLQQATMPRSSRGSAPRPASRPAPAPARPAPQQQQARPMTTAAHPGMAQQGQGRPGVPAQQAQQGGGSGLFGQMASTAA